MTMAKAIGYGGEVVDRAERVAQVLMSQVGEGTSVGWAAGLECLSRDEHDGNEACGNEVEAHGQRCGVKELPGVADPSLRALRVVPLLPAHQGHHAHPRLEAGDPESKLREYEGRDRYHCQGVAVGRKQGILPMDDRVRRSGYLVEANDNDDEVQEQIGPNQEHRDPDGLPKALEEHRTQQRDQEQGYGDLL